MAFCAYRVPRSSGGCSSRPRAALATEHVARRPSGRTARRSHSGRTKLLTSRLRRSSTQTSPRHGSTRGGDARLGSADACAECAGRPSRLPRPARCVSADERREERSYRTTGETPRPLEDSQRPRRVASTSLARTQALRFARVHRCPPARRIARWERQARVRGCRGTRRSECVFPARCRE